MELLPGADEATTLRLVGEKDTGSIEAGDPPEPRIVGFEVLDSGGIRAQLENGQSVIISDEDVVAALNEAGTVTGFDPSYAAVENQPEKPRFLGRVREAGNLAMAAAVGVKLKFFGDNTFQRLKSAAATTSESIGDLPSLAVVRLQTLGAGRKSNDPEAGAEVVDGAGRDGQKRRHRKLGWAVAAAAGVGLAAGAAYASYKFGVHSAVGGDKHQNNDLLASLNRLKVQEAREHAEQAQIIRNQQHLQAVVELQNKALARLSETTINLKRSIANLAIHGHGGLRPPSHENLSNYQYPWDWAVKKVGANNSMPWLHRLAGKAAQHGHHVQWLTGSGHAADGSATQVLKIDGHTGTSEILNVLSQYQ